MTRVVISQPMYFPWPGFLAQISLADVLIWLDDAQFSKGSFTNRVQVKLPNGRKWMSIPLKGKGSFQKISELSAIDAKWISLHRAMLQQSLSEHPYCEEALSVFDAVSNQKALIDILISSVEDTAKKLSILPAKRLKSSEMDIEGHSWQRVLKLVEAVGGDEYITGHGASSYMNHEAFEAKGVRISYMDYNPAPWPQPHGAFSPYVNILDLIAAVSSKSARDYLRPKTMPWRQFLAQKDAIS
jgi:hypothetical protein